MKIENNGSEHINRAQLQNTQQVDNQRAQAAQARDQRAAQRGDEVALSDKAKALSKAQETYKALPEIRSEKVEPLRQAVANGTYKVQHAALAKRLLGEA